MQDTKAAIAELERAVTGLGLKGAELDTIVNGENWDAPRFLPFFKAAEAMGAVLFYHPQPQHNFLTERTTRYGLFNSLGVILEDAIVVAILILGGVLEACPNLKVCIAHGGGPACYAMGRLDRGWQGNADARQSIPRAPSSYQKQLYYDTVVGSEAALRFMIDQVGIDRVVLGSDWPFVPWHPSPVTWVEGLQSLTREEKDRILWRNLETLLAALSPLAHQGVEKGPDARRRPKVGREAYSLYVERPDRGRQRSSWAFIRALATGTRPGGRAPSAPARRC